MRNPVMADLDWLGEVVLRVLREKTDLPATWFEGKREELAGRDRFNILLWFNDLDGSNLRLVADHFHLDARELLAAVRLIRCF